MSWSPLHLCVLRGNFEGIALLLAAGASPSLECQYGRTPLEHTCVWPTAKHVLRALLRGGSPLPRSSRALWMRASTSYYQPTCCQYVAKVRAAGSWAAYEKAHTARLVPVFEKIFPRLRLPHEIASHVVRFCFHTGDY